MTKMANYKQELDRRTRILEAEMGSAVSRETIQRAEVLAVRLFQAQQHREDFILRYLDKQYEAWRQERECK